MDLQRVEKELKNRLLYPYIWGRKQSDCWDSDTNFIYKTYSMKSLLHKTEKLNENLKNYAFNRWYNYWSAMAVEDIFASYSKVIPNKNIYDKLVDFTIDGIPFDHKTSVFPKGFKKSYKYAREHELELLYWLYNNQSQEGRKHLKNRLFIIMYDSNYYQHWKLKAEIMLIKKYIDDYVINFSINNLKRLKFGNNEILSDIIWIVK